jgi:hypothetical protein
MSYKNQLQEFLQKNNRPLPIYISERIDEGVDHKPIWLTCINMDSIIFEGEGQSKKIAECEAAKLVLEYILENNLKNDSKNDSKNDILLFSQKAEFADMPLNNYDKIYLIDGENYNIKKLPDGLSLIFVAKNTSKKIVFELQNKHDNCYVLISECVGKDAADHLLTFYAGKLSMLFPEKNYYVLTKDHYGEFLEKFMKNCQYICSGL